MPTDPTPMLINDDEDYFNLKSGGRDRPRSGSGPGGGFFSAAGGGGGGGGIMGNDPLAGLYGGVRRRILPQVAAVTGSQAPAVTTQGATAPTIDYRGGGQLFINGQPWQQVADEQRNTPSPDKPWTMPFDPNDPWAAFAGDTRNDFYGVLNRILAAAGGAGSFDPMGSQALIDMLEGKGVRDAGAFEAAARNDMAALGYDDPALAAFAGMQARRGAQGQLSDSLMDARIQQATSAQDFTRQALMAQLQAALSQYLNSQQAELQRYNESKRGGGGGWADLLGGAAGTAAGRWLSPGGFFKGKGK